MKNINATIGKFRVRYRHIRMAEEDGTDKGKILPRGGRTTAYIMDEDGKVLEEAHADCSEKDNYSKKIGRVIAAGRLHKKLKG